MGKILIAVCLCLSIIGCSKAEKLSSQETSQTQKRTLLIGLIPEQNIFKQIERYEPIADYLSEKIGVKIELKILPRYGNIIDNFVSLGLDGAFWGSFTYALAYNRLGLEVLARPQLLDGSSTYHGLIFVRKDSGIKTIKDLKGKRFALVDKATTAGYLLPIAYFKKHGIKDYRSYLKETYFSGTHEDAIYDVLNRKADIGAAKNTVYHRLADKDIRIVNELVILERSPNVPENGLAVRKNLDESIKKRLKDELLNMYISLKGREVLKNFGAQKFIETKNEDYEPVFKYAREIRLNLATYDYINE
ncbi:MAG: phosphate/phosphite/phosphonate ABC transporter substrate-binding protein [Nitrospirota bacterium]